MTKGKAVFSKTSSYVLDCLKIDLKTKSFLFSVGLLSNEII